MSSPTPVITLLLVHSIGGHTAGPERRTLTVIQITNPKLGGRENNAAYLKEQQLQLDG